MDSMRRLKTGSDSVGTHSGGYQGDETDPTKVQDVDKLAEWSRMCDFTNPLLPKTSPKIKLKCDERWGRYMVATEDINVGKYVFFLQWCGEASVKLMKITFEKVESYVSLSHPVIRNQF